MQKTKNINTSDTFISGKLSFQKKNILKNKSLHWLKIYGKVVFDKCKNPVKILDVVEDTTEPKLLIEKNNQLLCQQIKELKRLQIFESVISHIKEGILIIEILSDPSGSGSHKIIYCNDALLAISGYAKADIMGKTICGFNGGKGNIEEWQKFKESIVNKQAYEFEWMSHKENREVQWNCMSISPVTDSEGNYTHGIAILKDNTVRKQKDKEVALAILHTQETERFQIGAELHDNVNQILAGTLMSLGMAKDTMNKEQTEPIAKSIQYLRMAIEEIRRISHWLAPVYHDENSLIASFQKLLRDINKNNDFVIHFNNQNVIESSISSNIQLNLYRILQEQITNIIKYAQATVIRVNLKKISKAVQLSIDDNGIGIDTQKYQQGIGLNNIKKRVELLSGSFSLISSLGNGCKITVQIPLNEEIN